VLTTLIRYWIVLSLAKGAGFVLAHNNGEYRSRAGVLQIHGTVEESWTLNCEEQSLGSRDCRQRAFPNQISTSTDRNASGNERAG